MTDAPLFKLRGLLLPADDAGSGFEQGVDDFQIMPARWSSLSSGVFNEKVGVFGQKGFW